MEPVSPAPASSHAARHVAGAMPTIPPHSLIAFGLFLRLPGYAEVLLKERKKAQCLLRLVLGVTDDGDGGEKCRIILVMGCLYTRTVCLKSVKMDLSAKSVSL